MSCCVFDPGLAHMSRTRWPGATPRRSVGTIETSPAAGRAPSRCRRGAMRGRRRGSLRLRRRRRRPPRPAAQPARETSNCHASCAGYHGSAAAATARRAASARTRRPSRRAQRERGAETAAAQAERDGSGVRRMATNCVFFLRGRATAAVVLVEGGVDVRADVGELRPRAFLPGLRRVLGLLAQVLGRCALLLLATTTSRSPKRRRNLLHGDKPPSMIVRRCSSPSWLRRHWTGLYTASRTRGPNGRQFQHCHVPPRRTPERRYAGRCITAPRAARIFRGQRRCGADPADEHAPLTELLGESARDVDKLAELGARRRRAQRARLPSSRRLRRLLRTRRRACTRGDHDVAPAECSGTRTSRATPPLRTAKLRELDSAAGAELKFNQQ